MSSESPAPAQSKESDFTYLNDSDDVTAVLGLRVPASYYRYYKKQLKGSEQEKIREVLKQVFIQLLARKIDTTDLQGKNTVSMKVEVVEKHEQEDEQVLKLKKKIDQYTRELAKCTDEKLSLKDENESLKNKIKELEKQLQQTPQVQAQHEKQLDEKLRKLVSYLQLSQICLSNIDICDINAVIRNIDIIINENKEYTESRERIEQRFKSLYARSK